MGDWWTIVLIVVMAALALGLGWLFGADYGYRRGWVMGERSAAKRTRRQLEFADKQIAKVMARERDTIMRVYSSEPVG